MKRFILVLIMCFVFVSGVEAEVTAKMIGKEVTKSGSAKIMIQYKVDGVEVDSAFTYQGMKYWYEIYNHSQFSGMTKAQIKAIMVGSVKKKQRGLIIKAFNKKHNDDLIAFLDNLIGSEITLDSTDIDVDLDNDGVNDKTWTIKTDGTYVEKDIIIP